MDLWQAPLQLAFIVGGAVWADSPGQAVFAPGSVFVSEDDPGNFLKDPPGGLPDDGPVDFAPPFARIESAGKINDLRTPGRVLEARFRVHVTAGGGGVAGTPGANDTHGISQANASLRDVSGGVLSGQGKSTGRDVNEIMSRLEEQLAASGFIDSVHGFQGYVTDWDEFIPTDGVQILTRSFEITLTNATLSRVYHRVRRLAATSPGGGVVNLSWTLPPSRFDTPTVAASVVVRRGTNPGDPAPTDPVNGGNLVANVTTTTAQASGLTTGQTYNFSAFAAYTETPAAQSANTPDRYSAPVSISVNT